MKKRSHMIKTKLHMLWIPLAVLATVSVGSAVMYYIRGSYTAAAAATLILICCAFLFAMTFVISVDVIKHVTDMNRDLEVLQSEEFYNYPSPIVITDHNSNMIWFNRSFEENIFPGDQVYGAPLEELVGDTVPKYFSDSGADHPINDRWYHIKAIEHSSGLSIVSFDDCTEFNDLKEEYRASRKSVMLIVVDNYDEVLKNAKEIDKARFLVQIENLFDNFISQTNGIYHRLSNGRIYCILEERHLSKLIENKFKILLDEARKISLGERANVTLSIGVGRGALNLSESEKYANAALDMCFNRGGDQAAVKTDTTDTGFVFYGAKSEAPERSTKVRIRLFANDLTSLASDLRNIYIMGHDRADFDAVGASIGLCAALRSMGRSAYCVVNPETNVAKPLIKHVSERMGGDVFKDPLEAETEFSEEDLLIICDVHDPKMLDCKGLYNSAKKIVVIDHHRIKPEHITNETYSYYEPSASSTCEIITELIQYMGPDCKIGVPAAEALLCGIMLDTKFFTMHTGARTFEAAGYLKKLGADTVAVKRLFADTLENYREKSLLIQSAELFHGCAIASTESSAPELSLAAPQAADELLGLVGVRASFTVYRRGEKCYISARSMDNFSVQIVMEKLGGGGQQTIAGAQIDASLDETVKMLKDAIEDYITT